MYSCNCYCCYFEIRVDGCHRWWSGFAVAIHDAFVAYPPRGQRHRHANQYVAAILVTFDLFALAVQRTGHGAFLVFQFHRWCCILGGSCAASPPIALRGYVCGVSARMPFHSTKRSRPVHNLINTIELNLAYSTSEYQNNEYRFHLVNELTVI